jgi:hypothetical protein
LPPPSAYSCGGKNDAERKSTPEPLNDILVRRLAGGTQVRPRIKIIPDNDLPFKAEVLARFPGSDTKADLEYGLRLTYANVRVVDGPVDDDGRDSWHVYRDGYWAEGSR